MPGRLQPSQNFYYPGSGTRYPDKTATCIRTPWAGSRVTEHHLQPHLRTLLWKFSQDQIILKRNYREARARVSIRMAEFRRLCVISARMQPRLNKREVRQVWPPSLSIKRVTKASSERRQHGRERSAMTMGREMTTLFKFDQLLQRYRVTTVY